MKIKIKFIPSREWIFVKRIAPPKPVGHQALRNQDFKDHDYWPTSYAYYKQVTEKRILERYKDVVVGINGPIEPKMFINGEEVINEQNRSSLGKRIPIKPIPGILRHIPKKSN